MEQCYLLLTYWALPPHHCPQDHRGLTWWWDFIPCICHCLGSLIFPGTFPLLWDGIIWFLCLHWPYYCLPQFFSLCTLLHCFLCFFSHTTVLAGPTSQNALSHVSAWLLPSHVSSFFGETWAETDHFIPIFLVLLTLRPLFSYNSYLLT